MEEGFRTATAPAAPAAEAGGIRLSPALLGPLLLLLAALAYAGHLDAPLTSDARFLTVRNANVIEPDGIARFWTQDYFQGAMSPLPYRSGYYRPVTNSLFWLEYRWAGERSLLYNLMEVLLHGTNAFLVALLAASLARDRRVGALAGLLFVLHPIHAFAASEPAARADVLFATFYLTALVTFDRALARGAQARAPVLLLALVVVLYLLSVLSKEMGITLPAALVLLVAFRHSRDGAPLRRLLWTVPVWCAGAGYALWRFVILDLDPARMGYVDAHSRWALLGAGVKTIPIHVSRILLPLQPSYPELNPQLLNFVSGSATDPLTYTAVLVVGALAGGALVWRKSPLVAFWCAFFLITFSPLLKVDNIGGTLDTDVILTQERWVYLPAAALLALVAQGAIVLLGRAGARGRGAVVASLVGLVGILLALGWSAGVHAGRHNDPFANLRRLYLIPEDRLDRMHHANRLMLYANLVALPMGNAEDAEARARQALELVPDSPLVAVNVSRVLAARGKWQEVRELLAPWLAPSLTRLRALHETNFRVYDDFTRVSPEIAFLLARAEAHLGRPAVAARHLCESVVRGGEDPRTEGVWGEIWGAAGSPPPALPAAPPSGAGCAAWSAGLGA